MTKTAPSCRHSFWYWPGRNTVLLATQKTVFRPGWVFIEGVLIRYYQTPPYFIDCRSIQSRSYPWSVSGVLLLRCAWCVTVSGDISSFGRSFHFQGARVDCHQSAQAHYYQCACAAWRHCRNVSQFETHFIGNGPARIRLCLSGPGPQRSGLLLPPQKSGSHVQEHSVGGLAQ